MGAGGEEKFGAAGALFSGNQEIKEKGKRKKDKETTAIISVTVCSENLDRLWVRWVRFPLLDGGILGCFFKEILAARRVAKKWSVF